MSSSSSESQSSTAQQVRNLVIVLVAIVMTIAVTLGVRSQTGTVTLSSLAAKATPWEVAQTNGKPTLLEFYADWCTACQSMTGTIAQLEQNYGDRVNFVMLNVDNSKWLPELSRFGVDGIPEFVYFTDKGDVLGTAVGKQPLPIMEGNLLALAAAQPLATEAAPGATSAFSAPAAIQARSNTDDPRSHGGLPPN
jgi:thiol-disulfide isomerase/thioredoxin